MPAKLRTVAYRIDPFDLHLFAAVVECGTITAAARAVNLSLAAASARLQGLENAVGTPLLERSKAGAAPTDAGRALARQAQRVLGELETLHAEMAGFGRGLRGTVRLLCNTAALSEALPPKLGRFLKRHPELDLDVQELPSDAVLDGLRRGVAEVGIVADYVDTFGLLVREWLDDELVVLAPRQAAALGRQRSIRFADLLDRPLVGLSQDSGLSRYLARQAARSGKALHCRVRLANFDAVAQVVAAGVGVAVVPLSAARRFGGAPLKTVALSDAWAKRRLLVCTTPQAEGSVGVRALLDVLLDPAPR